MKNWEEKIKKIVKTPGVYLFIDKKGSVLYIGKASNLQRRVKSYFIGKDKKSGQITSKAEKIKTIKTETVLEALVKEAELIKKYKPPYNIKENDDRSFLYVLITKEDYPRVLLLRKKEIKEKGKVFGPFVYSSEIRMALKIIRKIFPYSTHTKKEVNSGKPCFDYQIKLCPGVCIGAISKKDYQKNIKNIELFFKGKKSKIILLLKKQMIEESKKENFEKAGEIKRKINSLLYIQDTAILQKKEKNSKKEKLFRIEGYDISNISGKFAVGSMVVFEGDKPLKKEHRLFKIKKTEKIDDVGMLEEVIERRLKNKWKLPLLFVVDGGRGQVNRTKLILQKMKKDIPVIGVAKGEKRKKEELVGDVDFEIEKSTITAVSKEAHRFAISYHRKIREKGFLGE